jgi:adenosylcobinamide kinase/adenosylcobinamide-phosphate guanylyltransferase
MDKKKYFVLGGASSGKSDFALNLAAEIGGPILFVATAKRIPNDSSWDKKILEHIKKRPSSWDTLEINDPSDLIDAIINETRGILIDSLTTWLGLSGAGEITEDLKTALLKTQYPWVTVSDEVGLGVHPYTKEGRDFREKLGSLNKEIASVADIVYFVISGCPLVLKGPIK